MRKLGIFGFFLTKGFFGGPKDGPPGASGLDYGMLRGYCRRWELMRRVLIILGVTLAALVISLSARRAQSVDTSVLPKLVLWAWERPEDLEFLDSSQVGVAYLAGTLHLTADEVVAAPRLQPLRVTEGTRMIAVIRVEPDTNRQPLLSAQQREQSVAAIIRLADRPAVQAVQIDFDARLSQRAFYTELLRELRRRLPRGQWLSITALASWCLDDNWIAGLPINEAVPMLFRMGRDASEVRRRLRTGGDFNEHACRVSLGVSTDEPLPRLPRGRRVYIFHPKPWTTTAAAAIMREVNSWR